MRLGHRGRCGRAFIAYVGRHPSYAPAGALGLRRGLFDSIEPLVPVTVGVSFLPAVGGPKGRERLLPTVHACAVQADNNAGGVVVHWSSGMSVRCSMAWMASQSCILMTQTACVALARLLGPVARQDLL